MWSHDLEGDQFKLHVSSKTQQFSFCISLNIFWFCLWRNIWVWNLHSKTGLMLHLFIQPNKCKLLKIKMGLFIVEIEMKTYKTMIAEINFIKTDDTSYCLWKTFVKTLYFQINEISNWIGMIPRRSIIILILQKVFPKQFFDFTCEKPAFQNHCVRIDEISR